MKQQRQGRNEEERVSVERQKFWKEDFESLKVGEGAGGKNSALAPGGSTVPTERASVLEDNPIRYNENKNSIFAEIVGFLAV